MFGKRCDELVRKNHLNHCRVFEDAKVAHLWLWIKSDPSRRTSTIDTDFDADFELPKKGKRETVAMIISSR